VKSAALIGAGGFTHLTHKSCNQLGMSAFGGKADIDLTQLNVRY